MYLQLVKQITMPPLLVGTRTSIQNSFVNSSTGDEDNVGKMKCSSRLSSSLLRRIKTHDDQPSPASKSVDFNAKVRVRKISTHRKFSQEEKLNSWWSADEVRVIRDEAIATVKKMMKKIPVDDDPNDCSRGLEYKTPKKNKIRQAKKMDIVWAVLSEQEAKEGWDNKAELIAQVYIACSRSSVEEAARRGAMDADEAWSDLKLER